ncbi:oxidoreductase [Photobacterium leiognathi subsp. mandapamensis]|nr:oxidoreductase [Photobacterium leiognathi subsp. mandapamensis]
MLSTLLAPWLNNQAVKLTCCDKWHETEDTISIKLACTDENHLAKFKPGQFVNIGINLDGKMEYRAYSLSSTPFDTDLQLTIKRVEGGRVSNFLIDQFQIGDSVMVLPPAGEFNSVDHPPQHNKALCISAGCGITPVYSMATTWLNHNPHCDVHFLHIARSPAHTIFFNELEQLNREHERFSLSLLLKDKQHTSYPQGRLDQTWLETLVPDLHERTVYLCGPTQFMEDVKGYLTHLDFDMSHFHAESFTPTADTQHAQRDTEQPQTVTLTVPSFNTAVAIESGSNIADVLEAQGVPLIIACRSGICGSCKCKATPNSTRSTSQATLTADEIEQGYILACSSQIISDSEISLG